MITITIRDLHMLKHRITQVSNYCLWVALELPMSLVRLSLRRAASKSLVKRRIKP